MLKLEKVKLTTGLNTDVSPKAIDTIGNRLVTNPIREAVNARYVSNDDGREFIFESVRGNVKITNPDLPGVGANLHIGSFEDVQNNVLLFWLYNSAGTHGIYEYNPEAGTISALIKSSFLNLQNDPRYLVTGIGVQGDLIYWSDGFNPQMYINRTRDYSAITSVKPLLLIKEHPTTRPDVLGATTIPQGHPFFRGTDASIPVNKIDDKNLQFSYQYIFIDNEKSVIAPFSKMAYAGLSPMDTLNGSPVTNIVPFRHTIPSDVYPFIKSVNLLVREGNEGAWSVWKNLVPASTAVAESYTGYEALTALADAESAKISEAVPTVSKALCVTKNRVIVSTDVEGFDVNLVGGAFPITVTVTEQFENYATGPSRNTYFKRGGARTFAIALFDTEGRPMGVFGKKAIRFTPADDANDFYHSPSIFETDTQRPYVSLTLSGDLSGSPKAAYFSIVCTDEEYYEDYMQVPVVPLFYKYEKGDFGTASMEWDIDGRVYVQYLPGNPPSAATQFNKMHLLLPKEAPIIPTEEYLVRMMSLRGLPAFSAAKIDTVIAVESSQFVVINNFGITNWSSINTGTYPSLSMWKIFVEIFKVKKNPSNIFYEITDRLPLVAGVPSQTSFTIYGDQYYVRDHRFTYRGLKGATSTGSQSVQPKEQLAHIESPSPTFGFLGISKVFKDSSQGPVESVRNTILDYSKKDWNAGKPFVELDNPRQLDRSNVLRFSNQFLPDSSINGLSSFDSGDEYPLPEDRSPIKKLVPIGNNVLAIHERSLTTLYLEQAMIKNAEGVEQLITTDRFIGYDRGLEFKVGAYHAESVVEYMGTVFGFDIYKGIPWAYDNNGAVSIANGREEFFEEIAKALLPNKNTCKILGGIDPEHKEYLISFVYPSGQEANNVTCAFNFIKRIWTVTFQFTPDGYGKINNKLIAFKDGELWVCNESSTYNNFFGVQYQRRLRIAVNPFPSRSKNFMALQIATNLLSSGSDPEMLVVKCYTEDGQETYMKVDDFEKLEGVFYGPILKDINTLPALIPAGRIALRDGDDMLGKYIEIELINDHSTDPCPVQFLNISYVDSEYTS